MSEKKLKGFLEKVKGEASLQEKLKAAADADEVIVIAKAAGFVVSAEEIKTAQLAPQELSDEELEGVAGGVKGTFQVPGREEGRCAGAVLREAEDKKSEADRRNLKAPRADCCVKPEQTEGVGETAGAGGAQEQAVRDGHAAG